MPSQLRLTRRAALAAIGAGTVVGLAFVLRGVLGSSTPPTRSTDDGGGGGMMGPGMMGVSMQDMSRYMEMFNRHNEITRTVEEIPGGVRTITQSDSPDLVAELQAHVSSMYSHVGQGAEVMCMSDSLPTLSRRRLPAAADYHADRSDRRGNGR